MKNLVSIFAAKANKYIKEEKPSELIPFKGEFPILTTDKYQDYNDVIFNTGYLEDCPEWIQEVILKGEKIYEIENGFIDYLRNHNISIESFKKKSSSDKATELMRFLNANSLTLNSLIV